MTNIQLAFHTIFLFGMLSIILDKIVMILNFILNYAIALPTYLITKKEGLLDIITSVISIISNLITFYYLTVLLNIMIILAEQYNLSKTTFVIIGCFLMFYISICTQRRNYEGEPHNIIKFYKSFCFYAYVPLFLLIHYLNIFMYPQPIICFMELFYKLFNMKIIGWIISLCMLVTVFIISIHFLIILFSLMKSVKNLIKYKIQKGNDI